VAYHPRENWDPRTRRRLYTRRDFLRTAGVIGLAYPTLGALLAACGGGDDAGDVEILIGTPGNPVTQPIVDSNPMIASGLQAESGPLRVYNWADYINPDVLPLAEEALGVDIEVTTFFNEEEALQKLQSAEVNFDVWFPTAEIVSKSVAGELIQPLNMDYIPNLANVWPVLQDPFYDQGSQYTVPYVLYQTGIGWRVDMADDEDILGLENPWDVFWNPKYNGVIGMYDDFKETLAAAMFRNGVADPRSASAGDVEAAAEALTELVDLVNIRYTIDGAYVGIPEGRFAVHHAWSGDLVNAQYYFPEDADVSVIRYLWPAKAENSEAHAAISNDTMTVLKGAENPVLAHQFLDWMLDEANALENFGWLGYQPPQIGIDPDTLVADEWVAEYISTAIVRQEDFSNPRGYVPVQLDPGTEATWLDAWSTVKSGG
jgi:spermidine/putrescine transport system substrate-binding protein